jgi:hypothetical protein
MTRTATLWPMRAGSRTRGTGDSILQDWIFARWSSFDSVCLCRTGGLRLDDFVELALWKRLRADDHFLYGGSDKHKLRYKQHTELGGSGATSIAITPGTFTSTSASGSTSMSPTATTTYTLTATNAAGSTTSTANRYRKRAKQTNDQLLHGQPHKYHFRFQQHAELGDDRGDQSCHHAGDIHLHIREWFDEREPNGDDHLHADCDQCLWLDHIHGKSHCNSARRSIGDNNHFVPRRNTRRGVCRLHNRRQRRLSALHLFRKHEFQLSSIA